MEYTNRIYAAGRLQFKISDAIQEMQKAGIPQDDPLFAIARTAIQAIFDDEEVSAYTKWRDEERKREREEQLRRLKWVLVRNQSGRLERVRNEKYEGD